MSALKAARAILANDMTRLLRDRFLLGTAAYIMSCAVALRWLVPWLEGELMGGSGFDIGPYTPLGVSYFVLVNSSVLTGMIGGFLLLESREERAIKALLVTPTPLSLHLGTLAAVIITAGLILAAALAAAVGVGTPGWQPVMVSAALGAPTGVVIALILATVASNKVEAFAVMKMTSFLGLIPVGAFFLPEPFQYAAGLFPPYWACKIWWVAAEGGGTWLWMVAPGALVSAAWIALLLRRFITVAYR